jgi:pyruvate/2-oxoglutarate dehydrogenase complex dihydrolipoamide dehydrogenase (E3) component
MTQRSADVVILGGGSGGYSAAIRASELGLSVILVESDKLGGTCLHRGCIPTKALLHAAEVADSACGAAQFGVSVGFDGIDISGVHQYKDSVVSRLYQGLQGLIAGHGVEVVSGRGSFVGALDRLVPNEDELASTQLTRALRRRKITSKTGVRFAGVEQDGEAVVVSLESVDTLEAEVLLVAVGHGPNTAGCGFDEAGIEMDHRYVGTDDRLRTNLPNVCAFGDIVPGLKLAHRGFRQGIFVAEEIAGRNPSAIDESGFRA